MLAERPGITLGVYWPFQAEFDPRPLVDWLIAEGSAAALPAVIDKKGPLEYRAWRPGDPLVDGVWNIPVPERRDIVVPQAVLAPLVGFDRDCYRLGYGGGYFDRTLAALAPRPLAIGVGFEASHDRDDPATAARHSDGSDRHRGVPAPALIGAAAMLTKALLGLPASADAGLVRC